MTFLEFETDDNERVAIDPRRIVGFIQGEQFTHLMIEGLGEKIIIVTQSFDQVKLALNQYGDR